MGIKLVFDDLTEEEAICVCSYREMNIALDDIREHLRGLHKYHEFEHEEAENIVEEIYDRFFEITSDIKLL